MVATRPPRCVYRLVVKRVWDTSGSPYVTCEQRLCEVQGVVLNVIPRMNPNMIPRMNPQRKSLYVLMIFTLTT